MLVFVTKITNFVVYKKERTTSIFSSLVYNLLSCKTLITVESGFLYTIKYTPSRVIGIYTKKTVRMTTMGLKMFEEGLNH